MKLISQIKIKCFRSIQDDTLKDLESFSTIVGLNNSGKSNYLRVLNLFFNNEIEPGARFDINRDYYLPNKKRGRRMEVKIEVFFNLPPHFKFTKKLENCKQFLKPPVFSITKVWKRNTTIPDLLLNGKKISVSDYDKIEQFLSLIKFRYIPNRVLPIDIIKNEHKALRDVIIRRASKKKPAGSDEVFKEIARISNTLTGQLGINLKETLKDLDNIRLATPTSLSEMIFAFGYKLTENGYELDDYLQGSGIQSNLMFDTLYLIDKDTFQRFGWIQAAIWAIEEPESSMHSDMIARTALFLNKISNLDKGWLQILATSHSDTILQYSDKGYLIKKDIKGSKSSTDNISNIIETTSQLGVSSWTHPLLAFPLTPLLIVEGKIDAKYFAKAIELLRPGILNKIKITYLEKITLAKTGKSGGNIDTANYLKENQKVIENRHITPVGVVFDCDSKNQEETLRKNMPPLLKIYRWNEGNANPKLGKEFGGIERFYSDRILNEIKRSNPDLVFENATSYTVKPSNMEDFKKKAIEYIEQNLQKEDLIYSEEFILKIISEMVPVP
jgi:hypothetical protein